MVYVPGIAGILVFYAAVLGVGVWAATSKRKKNRNGQDDMILANRSLGLVLGVFTLIATWVGGAFVSGTAEAMYINGLAWCQTPIGYSLSLLFGALLFAKPMRKAEYVTMLDPFQQRYGARIGGLMFLPALLGDIFWCSAVLKAFGDSLSIVAGLDPSISVCASALLVATYTALGGLYSIACTDVLQLACIVFGLAIATPYAILNPAVSLDKQLMKKEGWLGEIKNADLAVWLDNMLLLIFGGIPWQGYFQRVLSMKSTAVVRTLSIASMFGCLAVAVPSAMIGVVARATDWSMVEGFDTEILSPNGNAILPIVLRYLTPQWVGFLGLGSISAAVMSSADSSILASSSMFSRNIYRLAIRPKASEREMDWILRISILIISLLSAGVALTVGSVYYLSHLCWDLVYVVLFPQLLAVVHWPSLVDTYGCLAGYLVAIVLRICGNDLILRVRTILAIIIFGNSSLTRLFAVKGGEQGLGIPAFIHFPYYDMKTQTQKCPFRTTVMMTGLFTQLFVSSVTRNLLGKGYCPRCCDPLGVYSPGKSKQQSGVVQSSSGAALIDATLNETSTCHGSSGTPDEDSVDHCSRTSQVPEHYQQQQHQQHGTEEHNDTILRGVNGGSAVHRANQSLQNLQNLQSTILQTPGRTRICVPPTPIISSNGQILGVRNLPNSIGAVHPPNGMTGSPVPLRIVNPIAASAGVSLMGTPSYGRLGNFEKIREIDRIVDRSSLELNLNLNNQENSGVVKKNVMGVKLIGMEGGTLRRPSLQGTFSPTPSVELVNIMDRRQSGGSYGPSSLSPVPGVEACKTHGTAIDGQAANEHCRIKRGIVRHHSFNETGDRALTTLARQPNYPSMPLRTDDCRLTLMKKEKKSNGTIVRHSSVADDKGICGRGLVLSPTYSMYGSAVKSGNYYVTDDEAVSRF